MLIKSLSDMVLSPYWNYLATLHTLHSCTTISALVHVDISVLDLSLNPLLADWEAVAEITTQLKHLHTLDLR